MSLADSKEINLLRCLKCGKVMQCSRYDTAALLEHIRNDHPEVDIVDTDTKQKKTVEAELAKPPLKQNTNSNTNLSLASYLGQEDKSKDDCECFQEGCNAEKCRSNNKQERESYQHAEFAEIAEQSPLQPQSMKDVDLTQYSVTSEILEKYPEIKETEYIPHNPNAQVIYTKRYRVNTPPPVSPSVLQTPFQCSLYRTSIEKWCPVNGPIYCPKCGANKRPLIKTKAEHFTYNECMACCLLSCWPFCFLPWLTPRQTNDFLYCASCKTLLGLYDRPSNSVRPNRLYFSKEKDYSDGEPTREHKESLREKKLLQNEFTPQTSAKDSAKSKMSITINGKELPPETVARIQKYKKFGSFIGLDIDALSNPTDSASTTHRGDVHKKN